MSAGSVDPLFSQALALPEQKRLELAAELLASVRPPGVMSIHDPGLEDELLRRSQEIDNGTAELLDWPEAREQIRSQLKQRDSQ